MSAPISSTPSAPDSLTTTAASDAASNQDAAPTQAQLKQHWYTAADDCGFNRDKLAALCEALNSRGVHNKSRLNYVLRGEGLFSDTHARATAVTRLLLEYNTRRAGSQAAQDKWSEARRGLLALRDQLPEAVRSAPVFAKVEAAPVARPSRRREPSWRDQ